MVGCRSDHGERNGERRGGVVGAGPGTSTTDPATIERTYVNHAHNDYLELALEGGIPAIVLMLLFLAWWARRWTGRCR